MRNPIAARLSLLILLALAALSVWADDFSAELSRTRVRVNETLTLHLSADGQLVGTPDLSPLKQDFEVLNQATGTSMSIVNGATTSTREWTLELAPRRTGRLKVPPISLGGKQTKPITLEVVAADRADAGAGPKPIFVDTAVETTKSPFVQQSFPYRVRVLYREQPRRALLSDPEVEGATLERQGEDQSYTETIDGLRYTAIERRYLVVPQRSGPLTIRGPRLEALMPEGRSGTRRSPFADFNDAFGGQVFHGMPDLLDQGAGRRVIERGPDRTVEVRPQPAGNDGTWLPAESVQLSDEWTPSPPRFRVGEPVTRTLVITARGATADQLPTLDVGTPDGVKVYPEQPKVENLPGTVPAALKTLKVALVPTRAGALTLPEIRLAWWDTTTDQARVAVIPQRTVEVAPTAGEPAPTPSAPQPATAEAATAPLAALPERSADGGAKDHQKGSDAVTGGGLSTALGAGGPWPFVALFFALAWLGTLTWAVLRRRRQGGAPSHAESTGLVAGRADTLVAALARVRQACAAADPRATRAALLDWASARWPEHPPRGLGEIGARLSLTGAAVGDALERIDRAIYAPAGTDWDGGATWRQLEPALAASETRGRSRRTDPLPALYPRLEDQHPS